MPEGGFRLALRINSKRFIARLDPSRQGPFPFSRPDGLVCSSFGGGGWPLVFLRQRPLTKIASRHIGRLH